MQGGDRLRTGSHSLQLLHDALIQMVGELDLLGRTGRLLRGDYGTRYDSDSGGNSPT